MILSFFLSTTDVKSTLFVIFDLHDHEIYHPLYGKEARDMMTSVTQKLADIPDCTKLWITSNYARRLGAETAETIRLFYDFSITHYVVATILEVFNKRWETLDIVSMMKEVERTVIRNKSTSPKDRLPKVMITDSLSTLPRLKKKEEVP